MLEYLLFLNQHEKEIVQIIEIAGYQVEENTPLCLLNEKFFGFLKKKQRTMVICTRNAMNYGGYRFSAVDDPDEYFQTGLMIRRAVRHEAVHIAQECNNGNLINPSGKAKLKLSPYKKKALQSSISLTGQKDREYEAYALEDKPRLVKSALKKYCL